MAGTEEKKFVGADQKDFLRRVLNDSLSWEGICSFGETIGFLLLWVGIGAESGMAWRMAVKLRIGRVWRKMLVIVQ